METGAEIRRMRRAVGLTQRALAASTGISQPRIAAYEKGRVAPKAATLAALREACRLTPSQALSRRRDDVVDLIAQAHVTNPRVFGSVARGEDGPGSDLDLLVTLPAGFGLFRLVELEQRLAGVLGVPVDLVDDRASGRVMSRALSEAIAL
jgi:predicted nucleotidyltransferase/DNA-binding XRE family transcriptional regulator